MVIDSRYIKDEEVVLKLFVGDEVFEARYLLDSMSPYDVSYRDLLGKLNFGIANRIGDLDSVAVRSAYHEIKEPLKCVGCGKGIGMYGNCSNPLLCGDCIKKLNS